jgi:predicted nucleic acid-binding protein
LADQEGCDFVTADDKLMKALQGQFSFVVSLASLP